MNEAHRRRGPFRAGERVQLTDPKGRQYTISLTEDGYFQSTRGSFRHSELIGADEGTVLETQDGRRLLALRPLISDYVLSMPRGATVVYPKDAAQIVHIADVFPGARVFEAGVGSGALSMSLLNALGPDGHLTSAELRPEFAEIAQGNVTSWMGGEMPNWDVVVREASEVLDSLENSSLDHVILDMLAPWDQIEPAARALRPGGVILAYVATTTQMSRFVETLRESQCYTEPQASETLVRTWHLEGLAVRPDHRMVAHTGFLVVARRLASGSEPLVQKRRPAKAAYSEAFDWESDEGLAERTISPKKLRRVRRDVAHRADVEATGNSAGGEHGARIRERIESEIAVTNEERRRARAQARAERAKDATGEAPGLDNSRDTAGERAD
ncbi:tRNA (adenine-N1)-methyltransferase [Arcanobacterium haemolyticum]|nr:tRNA (adenine-N1)-methyltransferase [Arcanobacterium haemolyticum]